LINTTQNLAETPDEVFDESEFQSAHSLARESGFSGLDEIEDMPRSSSINSIISTDAEIERLKDKITELQDKKFEAERLSERYHLDLQDRTGDLEKLQSEKAFLAFELRTLHHKVKDFARQNERLKKVSVQATLAHTKDALFSTLWNQLEVKVSNIEKNLAQEKNLLKNRLAEEQKSTQLKIKDAQDKYTQSQDELRKARSAMRTIEMDQSEKERVLRREHENEMKTMRDKIEAQYDMVKEERDALQERIGKLEKELNNTRLSTVPAAEQQDQDKVEQIAKLQDKLDHLQREQFEKSNLISRQKVEIQNLTSEVDQAKQTISDLRTKLSKSEVELIQLKDTQESHLENTRDWEQKKNEELENMRFELTQQHEKEVAQLRVELEESHADQIAHLRSEISIKKDREAREIEEKILSTWESERELWEKQIAEMRKSLHDKEESDRQKQQKITQLESGLNEAKEKLVKCETDRAIDKTAFEKMISAMRQQVQFMTEAHENDSKKGKSVKTPTKEQPKATPTIEKRVLSMTKVVPNAQATPVPITRPPPEKMRRLASVKPPSNLQKAIGKSMLGRFNSGDQQTTLDPQKPSSDRSVNLQRALAKEGYLTKEGDKFKTWHRRFFRIVKDEGGQYQLLYFETQDARKPLKAVNLHGAFVSLAPEKENGTNRLFCFKLRTHGRILFLNANSRADREEWTKYLSIVIEEASIHNGEK
jgi:chromosome segregation ATPase